MQLVAILGGQEVEDRTREVFVIMPFTGTPTRNKADLTAFFENNLKEPIERHDGFDHRYRVARSDDSFDIGKKIVRDIFSADIVLCDLSGEQANPNVMYELGLRLALTNKPVIMFREAHADNKRIFDISIYHTHEYVVTRYRELEKYIIAKIRKFETGEETFTSPVLDILAKEPSVVDEIRRTNARGLLEAIHHSVLGIIRVLGGTLEHFMEVSGSKLEPPGDSRDLPEFLEAHESDLKDLPWNKFKFRPNVPPSVHSYLATNPLLGVVPAWVTKIWNTALSDYYAHFFATDVLWNELNPFSLHRFVTETFILQAALRDLLAYFTKVTQNERAKELNDMLDNLEHFLDWGPDMLAPYRKQI